MPEQFPEGPPRCPSSLRVLRRQGAAKHKLRYGGIPPSSATPPLAFRSLDPFRALRDPDRRLRDEERPSSSEQRTGSKSRPTSENPISRSSLNRTGCKL